MSSSTFFYVVSEGLKSMTWNYDHDAAFFYAVICWYGLSLQALLKVQNVGAANGMAPATAQIYSRNLHSKSKLEKSIELDMNMICV